MKTPITDAAVESDQSVECAGDVFIDASIARRLELDRAALMEALEQLESDVFGYGNGSGWTKARAALSAARANFPEQSETAVCDQCRKPAHKQGHTCPYKSDVNGDDETLCHCCPSCTQDCCDSI